MNMADILIQPEGRRLEFKSSLPEANGLEKTIIAFSNDAGGDFYLGIQDNPREIIGRKAKRQEPIFELDQPID